MIKTILTCALLAVGSSAYAGSFNPAVEDPIVVGPSCTILGLIPCHGPSRGTTMDGSGTPTTTTTTTTTEPEQEQCTTDDRKEEKKSSKKEEKSGKKGNASANDGRGGNYDKTGHDDNGRGEGRNKK